MPTEEMRGGKSKKEISSKFPFYLLKISVEKKRWWMDLKLHLPKNPTYFCPTRLHRIEVVWGMRIPKGHYYIELFPINAEHHSVADSLSFTFYFFCFLQIFRRDKNGLSLHCMTKFLWMHLLGLAHWQRYLFDGHKWGLSKYLD